MGFHTGYQLWEAHGMASIWSVSGIYLTKYDLITPRLPRGMRDCVRQDEELLTKGFIRERESINPTTQKEFFREDVCWQVIVCWSRKWSKCLSQTKEQIPWQHLARRMVKENLQNTWDNAWFWQFRLFNDPQYLYPSHDLSILSIHFEAFGAICKDILIYMQI